MIVGKVIEEAARQMADRVGGGGEWTARADAHLAEHGPLTISHRYHDAGGTDWDEGSYRGDAYPCYGWACDVVEVEVDTDTGEVRLLDVWMAQDIGKAIHPVMCEGQIEGGTLQGIGHLLLEEVVMADGAYRNDRMTNYIIPTSLDTPPMHTQLIEVPYPHGPFGAKGVGELPMDGIGPAIASAIEHATGIFIERQPALPEYLLELWEAKR